MSFNKLMDNGYSLSCYFQDQTYQNWIYNYVTPKELHLHSMLTPQEANTTKLPLDTISHLILLNWRFSFDIKESLLHFQICFIYQMR